MKRICFLEYDSSIIGGTTKVTEVLSKQFVATHQVFIYSMSLSKGKTAYSIDPSVQFTSNNIEGGRLRNIVFANRRTFRRYVTDNKLDIVIAVSTYTGLLCAITPIPAKIIFADHGALINQIQSKSITFIRFLASFTSNKVVVLTNQTKADYQNIFKVSHKKVVQIYNPIEEQLQNQFNCYTTNSNRIITVGRLSEEKGFDLLLKVATIVLEQNPTWYWDVYGEGDLLKEMRIQTNNLGLSDQLQFLGNDRTVTNLLSGYSMLVLTSYREGLPMCLLEGKACGLPLISFDIATGPNGYLIKPYDVNEMANKINELIIDSEKRYQFHIESKRDMDKFKMKDIEKQWLELFEDML